jgi:hypothetical protein
LGGGSVRCKAATYTQNIHTHTTMPGVRFEPTIPVFERAKPVYALDSAATVFVTLNYTLSLRGHVVA